MMLKTGVWLRVHDIPGILHSEDALSALHFYRRWKEMGMPYGPWGENPEKLCQIVDILRPLDKFYFPEVII